MLLKCLFKYENRTFIIWFYKDNKTSVIKTWRIRPHRMVKCRKEPCPLANFKKNENDMSPFCI